MYHGIAYLKFSDLRRCIELIDGQFSIISPVNKFKSIDQVSPLLSSSINVFLYIIDLNFISSYHLIGVF